MQKKTRCRKEKQSLILFIFLRINISSYIFITTVVLGLTDQNVLDIIRLGFSVKCSTKSPENAYKVNDQAENESLEKRPKKV